MRKTEDLRLSLNHLRTFELLKGVLDFSREVEKEIAPEEKKRAVPWRTSREKAGGKRPDPIIMMNESIEKKKGKKGRWCRDGELTGVIPWR